MIDKKQSSDLMASYSVKYLLLGEEKEVVIETNLWYVLVS